jgi:hypothetical protein
LAGSSVETRLVLQSTLPFITFTLEKVSRRRTTICVTSGSRSTGYKRKSGANTYHERCRYYTKFSRHVPTVKRKENSLTTQKNVVLSWNLNNAENRFHSLQRIFNSDAQFREMYYSQILDYTGKGQAETVASEE